MSTTNDNITSNTSSSLSSVQNEIKVLKTERDDTIQRNKKRNQMRSLTPKHQLRMYYDKVHTMQLCNSDYYTWRGEGVLWEKFTSLFLCPKTGIIFSSNHGEAAATTTTDDIDVYWYNSYKKAEHSAAARACNYWLQHSNKPTTTAVVLDLPIPSTCIPKFVLDKIICNQQQIISSKRIRELEGKLNFLPLLWNTHQDFPPLPGHSTNQNHW